MAKSVEDVYRRHVQHMTTEERMQLIALTAQGMTTAPANDGRQRQIGELHGLGREIWQGVDAQKLVSELRDEWNA